MHCGFRRVVNHHAYMLDLATAGGQRQQGDVLVHKVDAASDGLIVFEVHQVGPLLLQVLQQL